MIQVNFAGFLARDPEVKQGKNNPFTTFTIGATHGAKDGKDGKVGSEFVECIAGGKMGETIATYCHKGDQLIISGTLYKTNGWTGKDGQAHGAINVSVNNFDFGRRKNGAESTPSAAPAPSAAAAPTVSTNQPSAFADDEIPF